MSEFRDYSKFDVFNISSCCLSTNYLLHLWYYVIDAITSCLQPGLWLADVLLNNCTGTRTHTPTHEFASTRTYSIAYTHTGRLSPRCIADIQEPLLNSKLFLYIQTSACIFLCVCVRVFACLSVSPAVCFIACVLKTLIQSKSYTSVWALCPAHICREQKLDCSIS